MDQKVPFSRYKSLDFSCTASSHTVSVCTHVDVQWHPNTQARRLGPNSEKDTPIAESAASRDCSQSSDAVNMWPIARQSELVNLSHAESSWRTNHPISARFPLPCGTISASPASHLCRSRIPSSSVYRGLTFEYGVGRVHSGGSSHCHRTSSLMTSFGRTEECLGSLTAPRLHRLFVMWLCVWTRLKALVDL